MDVRHAEESEVDRLATIWHEGWHEAHAHLLPEELARDRTLASMRARMTAGLASVRVVGPVGAPIGFSMTKEDQLFQLFVAPAGRGTGAAATLVADVEARMREAGVPVVWLACAIGNVRAARFYEKCGWRLAGTAIERLLLSSGELELSVWRFEKVLADARDA
jgi:GNAT superfamily N-acetyltransferase